MPAATKWLGPQKESLRALVSKGLRAGDIFKLSPPRLRDFSKIAIRNVIRKLGLADKQMSERAKNARRLSLEEQVKLIAYLRERLHLPDSVVALKFKVSKGSVSHHRRKAYGKHLGPKRFSRKNEEARRQGMSLNASKKREEKYKELCRLQTKYENEGLNCKIRVCRTCTTHWFETREFFYPISRGQGFFQDCKICRSEKMVLRHQRLSKEEVDQKLARLFTKRPTKTREELLKLFEYHRKNKGLVARVCEHCRSKWPDSWQYFHCKIVGNQQVVTNICLACPAERQFFCKESVT